MKNALKYAWFREYVTVPGDRTRVQVVAAGPTIRISATDIGVLLTKDKEVRLYPWSVVAWVDYATDPTKSASPPPVPAKG